jgi:hypothetical protein
VKAPVKVKLPIANNALRIVQRATAQFKKLFGTHGCGVVEAPVVFKAGWSDFQVAHHQEFVWRCGLTFYVFVFSSVSLVSVPLVNV